MIAVRHPCPMGPAAQVGMVAPLIAVTYWMVSVACLCQLGHFVALACLQNVSLRQKSLWALCPLLQAAFLLISAPRPHFVSCRVGFFVEESAVGNSCPPAWSRLATYVCWAGQTVAVHNANSHTKQQWGRQMQYRKPFLAWDIFVFFTYVLLLIVWHDRRVTATSVSTYHCGR